MLVYQEESGKRTITRQSWKDWFFIEISHGMVIKRWYLPVSYRIESDRTVCWFFLLAPFVLFYEIIRNMFWSAWKDLYHFNKYQTERRKFIKEIDEEFEKNKEIFYIKQMELKDLKREGRIWI